MSNPLPDQSGPSPYRTLLHDGRGWVLKEDADRVRAERDRLRDEVAYLQSQVMSQGIIYAPPDETTRRSPAMAIETQTGVDLIAAERQRQVGSEGWTPEHDDEHGHGELAAAAACYATEAWMPLTESHRHPPPGWPWAAEWWKPTGDAVRDLVKAGALIAAEIDRLDRLSPDELSAKP